MRVNISKKKYMLMLICVTFCINLFACKLVNTSISNVEINENIEETNQSESKDNNRKFFYDMYGYRRTRGLHIEDDELYYYEDGYKQYDKVIEAETFNMLDIIIDKDGVARLDKKRKRNLYKNAETNRVDENTSKVNSIPYLYSKVSYSLSYALVDDKLYLIENGNRIKKYKNEFHTFRKTDDGEIDDNVNMPEEQWGSPRFNYLGEMEKRPREETYYFLDDCNLAFDGVYKIKGKKYLFDDRGVLAKKKSYFNSEGIGYLSNEEGIVIENEGFYTTKPYNEKGELDTNCSYVGLFEWGSPFVEKLYYVNSDGRIERNKLFIKDGAVYYSNEEGVLIRNSFLTNKYYFGNDCRLVDDSINETNIEKASRFIDYAFSNGSYDRHGNHVIYECSVMNKKRANEYKEKIEKLRQDPKNIIDEDYMTIVKDDDKLYINGELVKNKFVYDDDVYCCIGCYCDSDGKLVKNDLVNVDDDINLIDKYGNALASHKLTKRVINENFEGKTIDKLMKYENYFVDDTGRVLIDYQNICESLIKNANANQLNSKSKIVIPNTMYSEKIEQIINKENAIIPPDYTEDGLKVKEIHQDAFDLPNVLKTVLIDINNDGTKELIVFKKDYIVYKYDNYVDDEEEGIHPRLYFLTADLYKYENNNFSLLQSRKLIGCFYRYGELLRVGFKKGKLDRWLMYVEWRGESYGDGSFVDFKYYDFNNEKINLKFTEHLAGSSVGEDALYLNEIVNQTGVNYEKNDFYDYKDSYLEQDTGCKLVLGIDKDYDIEEEYGSKYLLPIEIIDYGERITNLE